MNTIKNTIYWIEKYNRIIKCQLKENKSNDTDEKKTNLDINIVLPDFDLFKSRVQQILESDTYPTDFVYSINWLYCLSDENSDLLSLSSVVEKNLYKKYPLTKELERLSMSVLEFIRDDIFEAEDKYGRSIVYKNLDWTKNKISEYLFKNDHTILWSLYHFLQPIVDAHCAQELVDFKHQLSFKSKSDAPAFIQQQKDKRVEQIMELSRDFCNRDLPFLFIQNHHLIDRANLTCNILSDVLERLSVADYTKYVEFDYSTYPKNFRWEFSKKSINDYTDLVNLPQFSRMLYLLSNTLFVKELEYEHKEATVIIPNKSIENTILSSKEKTALEEYILPVPLLNEIYETYNGELWQDISLVEFLSVFTTTVTYQQAFRLTQKTRFYYLLKKIWINSPIQAHFDSEKAWVGTFLSNYKLSASAYWNQSVKNEASYKNRQFISAVDKILRKENDK